MRYALAYICAIFLAAWLAGCATVSKTIEGPGGYKYSEQITASGKSNIEAATQTFGGSLKVESPDGTKVDAKLDSGAGANGVQSDNATAQLITQILVGLIQQIGKTPIAP